MTEALVYAYMYLLFSQNLVDGSTTAATGYFRSYATGNYIQFTFNTPLAVVAIKLYLEHAFTQTDKSPPMDATFKLQGVDSTGVAVDIGTPFAVDTATFTQSFSNAVSYSVYRFIKASGTSNSPQIFEVEFPNEPITAAPTTSPPTTATPVASPVSTAAPVANSIGVVYVVVTADATTFSATDIETVRTAVRDKLVIADSYITAILWPGSAVVRNTISGTGTDGGAKAAELVSEHAAGNFAVAGTLPVEHVFMTSTNAPLAASTPAPAPTTLYTYSVSSWGACSLLASVCQKTRAVSCTLSGSSTQAPTSLCDGLTPPPSTAACLPSQCPMTFTPTFPATMPPITPMTYSYQTTAWGQYALHRHCSLMALSASMSWYVCVLIGPCAAHGSPK